MSAIAKKKNVPVTIAALSLVVCLILTMMPQAAFADAGEGSETTFKNWKELYGELGVDISSGYDSVTSATNYASSHAQEGSGASGIPAVINRVKDTEGKTTALDGANIPSGELKDVKLLKASHKTFEQAAPNKKYGTDEFLIEPYNGTDIPGTDPAVWSWNAYFDSVYAVTVSNGEKTVGAVPWIDFYGQKGRDTGTSGTGHYNYVEVALNSGAIPTQPTMEVHRYDDFYENGELKSGKYTVTVYSTVYKPLVAADIWVPARSHASVSLGEATSESVPMTFDAALPEDFQPTYTVDGKPATFSNGTLSFDTIKPGNHNVVITSGNVDSDGNKKYLDVNASFTYSVTEAAVAFDGEKLVATGSDLTVSDYVSSITKVNVDGKDYSATGRGAVTVINEDGTIDLSKTESAEKTGSVSLTVTAAGYPELSFATNDLQYASIPAIAAKTYTGKAFTPDVTAKYADKELVKDTDYTITYANNKNAGTAKVTITGIGSYTGTKTVTFRINKAKQPMTAKAAAKSVKFKAVKKKVLTVKPITVKKAQGTVSYKKAGGDKKLTINARSGKVTVKKGASKGLHKITVKIKAKGNRNYKAGAKTVTVKVRVR